MNRRGRHARWPLLVGLLLLLALIPFAFLRSSQVPEAEAAWWNESWRYRQSIAVTNNTTEQTNVYISVNLDTSNTSKFQADCGDLRFTKQNGQLLPYYIVSGCGTASTSVHIQLDTFPAGAQTLYAYYGNPSADNGFSSNDFLTEATNYAVGGTGSEETGPGPVAYWKFDEGSGSTAFDSASYGLGDEVLVDGNMEAADTSEWIASTYATLSKETSNPHEGSRLIRVANNSGSTAQVIAHQEVLSPGKTYRVSGYARSDGVAIPKVVNYSQLIWQGSKSTEWQYFEVVFTAITTWGAEQLRLEGYFGNGVFAEYDDVSVMEIIAGNTGTITGATWANEDQCVSGKCLTFDGVDDKTSLVSPLDLGTTHTVEAWFKPTATINSFKAILGGADSTNYAIFLNGESIYYKAQGSTVSTSMPVQTNTWYHYALVRSGTSIKYFLNGKQIDTDTLGSNNSLTVTTIGAITNSYNFPGLIDEVKIFPYALSEDQIKAEYNLGAAAVMGTGPTVAPPAGGTLSESLVAYWAFDEQYGQAAHDKVGNHHGTFGAITSPGSDDPTWKPSGECKVNGCLNFDGTGDYVQLSTSEPFKITSKSVTFWGNLTSIPNTFRLAVGGNSSNWYTGFASNGRMISSHVNSTWSQRVTYSSTNILTDNTWDHYAYTWDVNGSIVTVRLYKNGKLVGSDDFADGYSSAYGSLFILGALSPSSAFFQGKLDELKIYNVALTADQVKQDMNAGASVAYSVGSEEADELADGAGAPPIAEWKFDEKQGTIAYDSSGHANDGTVNGATWKSGCQQGACLEFDGNDDYVKAITSITGRSISMWVYIDSDQTPLAWNYLLDARYGAANSWYAANGTGSLWTKQYINGVQTAVSYAAIPKDEWAHLYLEASNNFSDDINFMSAGGSNQTLKGMLDHVRIYDYARTPAQIAYDYNRGAPVAHWKFDECEGIVAHDASGNENHGTINIGATGTQTTAGTCSTSGAWANGKEGKFSGSLNFDGVDDYADLGSPDYINSLQVPMTITGWFKQNGSTGYQPIFAQYKSTSLHRLIKMVRIDNGNFTYFTTTSTGGFQQRGTFAPAIGQWHFFAIVTSGTLSSPSLSIYLDNNHLNYSLGSLSSSPDTSTKIYIGGDEAMTNERFNGLIDDVRIYNYALSPAQIQKVYNQGYSVRYGSETGNP